MKGCLLYIVMPFIGLMILLSTCEDEGDNDCTILGEPGSAQEQRDIEQCIKNPNGY